MTKKELDIVVYGATGVTGKRVAIELADCLAQDANLGNFKWAVAGRSRARLQAVVHDVIEHLRNRHPSVEKSDSEDQVSISVTDSTAGDDETELGEETKVPASIASLIPRVIIADSGDEESLASMASRAKVVIACVGPFRLYGEPVVRACIENSCHYVDVSGETEVIEKSVYKNNDDARAAGVSIVHACGFDSIPADIGALYTRQAMATADIIPSSVEMFVHLCPGPAGMRVNYATLESAVYSIGSVDALRRLRKESGFPSLPTVGPRPRFFGKITWWPLIKMWSLPFMSADPAIVRLSQQLALIGASKTLTNTLARLPPVHFGAYVTAISWWNMAKLAFFGGLCSQLIKFRLGRWLVLRFPAFFTCGMFSRKPPTQAMLDGTTFVSTFVAKGYVSSEQRRQAAADAEITPELDGAEQAKRWAAVIKTEKPDRRLVAKVSGPEPGYVATPICVVQCALIVLSKDVPRGVLTPAAAFADTDLVSRLTSRGIKFESAEPETI
ncbi:hypothetical protein GQ42DRAFT_161431 [Ramicandelaber brevisporus]|nr:hypothetical protein GQ42DRAFT_161431 [Ramicandelaber brevisporus]